MIRPSWTGTDEQNELLSAAVAALANARTVEGDAWKRVQAARDAGVPDTVLCGRGEIHRSTLNRKLGPRRTPELGADEQ